MDPLKVSAKTNPHSVAAAMMTMLKQRRSVELLVVGAGALNQAMKAVAIARPQLLPEGWDVVVIPSFQPIEIDGEARTGINLKVEHRPEQVIDLRDSVLQPRGSHVTS